MSLATICQWIQETPVSTLLRESTWGFPAAGALHVLGIAWFGGTVLFTGPEFRAWKRVGLAAMLATGALLFWIEPVKCYTSGPFRLKMFLLALLAANAWNPARRLAWVATLTLLGGMIFAARWIAYF
jgi:hypothetical protein